MTHLNWTEFLPFGQAIGWTLLHSIWQIALVGFLLRLLLWFIPQQRSRLRYGLLLTGLITSLFWAAFTFWGEWSTAKLQKAVISASVEGTPVPDAALERWQVQQDPVAAFQPASPEQIEPGVWLRQQLGLLKAQLSPYLFWLALIWYLGVVMLSGFMLAGFYQMHRLKTRNVRLPEAEWQERFNALVRKMGIRKKVSFLISASIKEPVTFHFFRPVVLAPIGIFTGLSPQQVEVLLLHELAHIRRYDFLVNIFQSVIEVLFFYHPTVWWISGKLREVREHCCDDLVLQVRHQPMLYAEALTHLQLFHHPRKTKLVMYANGKKGNFSNRILRLFGQYDQQTTSLKGSLIGLLLIICLVFQGFLAPAAQPQPGISTGREIGEVMPMDLSADQESDISTVQKYTLPQGKLPPYIGTSMLKIPIEDEVHLEIGPFPQSTVIKLSLSSLDGQSVHEFETELAKAALHRVKWDVSNVSKGIYWLATELDGYQLKERVGIGVQITPEGVKKDTRINDAVKDSSPCGDLLRAVKADDLQLVRKILQSDSVHPDCSYFEDGEPRTALVAAARKGNLDMVKLLIEADAKVEFHAKGDETPLMAAAQYGHLNVVQYLVAQKADVNRKVSGDGTALLVAARSGHLSVVRYLLEQDADINAEVSGDGTALINAARNGQYEVAKLLLEHGADPFQVSPGDEYAMYHARMNGDKKMIQLLRGYEEK